MSVARKITNTLYLICLDSKLKERGNKVLERYSEIFEDVNCHTAVTPKNFEHYNNDSISWLVHDKILKKNRDSHCDITEWSQIACYLSHIDAWNYCIKQNKPIYVGEDDVFITNLDKFRRMLQSMPNCKFASILNLFGSNQSAVVGSWASVDRKIIGAQLYYITPESAKILLKSAYPIMCHVDIYMTSLLPQKMKSSEIFVNTSGNLNWESISKSTLNHQFSIKPFLSETVTKVIMCLLILGFILLMKSVYSKILELRKHKKIRK